MATTFILPELGEDIDSGTVTRVLVAVGDTVAKDQPVLELETDKAVLEVPSPTAGNITEIFPKEGDTLRVGDAILIMDGAAPAPAASTKDPKPARVEPPVETVVEPAIVAPPAKAPPPEQDEAPEPPSPPRRTVTASPAVRRLARQIGVDVQQVTPSNPTGRVSMDDVKAHARRVNTEVGAGVSSQGMIGAIKLPNFARWGEVESKEMPTVRRRTAERMSASWATVPQVTQHDEADVTELETLRKKYGPQAAAAGGKLTVTAILVKILASALKKFPQFNSSVDAANNAIIYKKYYNIGIAVETDRGLLVPIIKNADEKNLVEISVELSEMAERARNRKSTLEEMQGSCMTITNLGGIGGTAFTPIVNAPEVAILGVARSRVKPVHVDGHFVPRMQLPISLSYDHRVIDGADAARFARWVCEALEQPFLLHMEG